jgi:hypothetical protein
VRQSTLPDLRLVVLRAAVLASFRRYAASLREHPEKRHYAVRLHPPVGCETASTTAHQRETMRPLLLSGLLCVPAVVMLNFGWPHDRGGRVEDATVAPAPMAAVSQSSTLTVSLPPRSQREPPQMDLDAWELVGTGSLTAELTPSEPALSRRKPIRALHARASALRPASPVIVAQTTFRERPDTVWARVVQWLTQHEAGKMWSQAGAGGGAG